MRLNKQDKISCKALMLLAITLFLTLIACAQQQAPAPESKIVEKPETPATEVGASWQQEWEDLIKAAQKEGTITMYGSLDTDTVQAFRKHFGEKYNIKTEIVVGKSAELTTKLSLERAAGIYIPDIYIEGPTSPLLVWKPQRILQNLNDVVFRPDVLDEKIWWGAFGPFFDKDRYLAAGSRGVQAALTINTDLVSPKEFTSYNHLLNPKWKGKIAMRYPYQGAGESIMVGALIIMGEDYIKKLAEQIHVITDNVRLLVEWVARGKYPIAFGTGSSMVYDFVQLGAPLELIALKEGSVTSSTATVVIFDPAPHPNAARLFVNWYLTREAQQIYALSSGRASRRLDVSDEHVEQVSRMREGYNYILQDEKYYLERAEKYIPIVEKHYAR